MDVTTAKNPFGHLATLLGLSVGPDTSVKNGTSAVWKQLSGFTGTNVIPIPHATPPPAGFKLFIQSYMEQITFRDGLQQKAAGTAANRGLSETKVESLQTMGSVTYDLFVNDAASGKQLHFENGMWLNQPPPVPPSPQATTAATQIGRLATIPHGDSVLTTGKAFAVDGPPEIPIINISPSSERGRVAPNDPILGGGRSPYAATNLNPNSTLQACIDTVEIKKTTVLEVSTRNQGGIINTPFTKKNVDPREFSCTYWISELASGHIWLIYSQQLKMVFNELSWPHVEVNILVLSQ